MFQAARWATVLMAGLVIFAPVTLFAADAYKLDEPADDNRVFGVGTRLNLTGDVQMIPKGPLFPQTLTAALSYRERRLLGPGSEAEALRSAREYEIAEAEIKVGDTKTSVKLPETMKLVVAQGRLDGVELYAMNGLLTADELDLMRSPADSLALIALLPGKDVEVGDKWKARDWAFQMLTALDAVSKGELECTFESFENGLAKVKFEGSVEGAAVGAMTEVKISGFFTYNVADKYIRDVDFTQKETRAVGPVIPGLDLSARVRILRQPVTSAGKLGDQKTIETAGANSLPAAKFLRFESPMNFSLQHGRYWKIYTIDDKIAKFRLILDGEFVAQADIAMAPSAKPGTHMAEQIYLDDIRKSVGDRLKTMTNGEVIPANDNKFAFKVRADGSVNEKPVTWIFYLVTDPSGRQASIMFNMNTDLVEKLGNLDRELVDSMRFGPAPLARSARN